MEVICNQNFRDPVEADFFSISSDFYSTTINENGIVIDDKTFRHNNLDHMKRSYTLLDVNGTFEINDQETYFVAELSARQFFRNSELIPKIPSQYINRIHNIYEDPRLACSGMYVVEESTNMTYMILLTSGMIYGLYGREMKLIKTDGDYTENTPTYKVDAACFYSLIPLSKRGFNTLSPKDGALSEFTKVGLGICADKVSWYINDSRVFTVDNIGYRIDEQYSVVDHGGINVKTVNSVVKMGFGHFAFMDFQLPNNYSRQMTSIDISGGIRVERSCSGLAQLYPTEYYKEIYPNTLGIRSNIIPEKTFAIGYDEASINSNFLLFGQGVVTIIKTLSIIVRDSSRINSKITKNVKINRKKIPRLTGAVKKRERFPHFKLKDNKDSDTDTDSSDTDRSDGGTSDSSESESVIPCPKRKTHKREDSTDIDDRKFRRDSGEFTHSSSSSNSSSSSSVQSMSSTEPVECDQRRPKMTMNREMYMRDYGRDFRKKYSETSSEAVETSESTVDSSDSGFISMDKIRDKPDNSLETLDSLESVGISLSRIPHNICWICRKLCGGICCGGSCGSMHCNNKKARKPIVKGVKSTNQEKFNMKESKPVKFVYGGNRFR